MQLQDKLSTIDLQKIEGYWYDHEANKKRLKFLEWEITNPHNTVEEQTGIRAGNISKPTERIATALVEDKKYQNLKTIISVIDTYYHELDDEERTIVNMRYWDKGNNCYEWEDIAQALFMSRSKVLKKRNVIIDETAKRIGWI